MSKICSSLVRRGRCTKVIGRARRVGLSENAMEFRDARSISVMNNGPVQITMRTLLIFIDILVLLRGRKWKIVGVCFARIRSTHGNVCTERYFMYTCTYVQRASRLAVRGYCGRRIMLKSRSVNPAVVRPRILSPDRRGWALPAETFFKRLPQEKIIESVSERIRVLLLDYSTTRVYLLFLLPSNISAYLITIWFFCNFVSFQLRCVLRSGTVHASFTPDGVK